ncbi:MAG: hypothetical protein WD766_08690 [Gemmatimonadota bacterium]
MRRRTIIFVGLLGLAGCEPEAQLLPLEVSGATNRTIASQGGSISSPAGVAIHFPAGAFTGSVSVGLETTSPPGEISTTGEVASEAFAVTPEGLQLGAPASLEMAFSEETDAPRAWLATVVSVANGILQPYAASRVDLATGVVEAEIDELGTFAVVIPSPQFVFPVKASTGNASFSVAALDLLGGADSVTVFCGGSASPCSGITSTASQNLLDKVEEAALLYPAAAGALRVDGASASGSINASATVRVLTEAGETAESVVIDALVETTPGTTVSETSDQLVFTNMRFRISGQAEAAEEISTLVVRKVNGDGVISLSRSFEIQGTDGAEPASVTLEIPVLLHP